MQCAGTRRSCVSQTVQYKVNAIIVTDTSEKSYARIGPCKQSFPWLDNLVREYGSQNFVVIGVNIDKDRDRAQRFLDETPADFQLFMTRRTNSPWPTTSLVCRRLNTSTRPAAARLLGTLFTE